MPSTPTPRCRSSRSPSSSTRTSATRARTASSSSPSRATGAPRPSTRASTPSPGGSPASSPACSWPLLLYVLARLLFRRREVAVFLAALVALDGMLFAQSRIGMNDAYVGLGIVAAYTVFAALWRSPGGGRRRWIAFAIGMPLIGFFLGFALAAKWVAAYAIGALGILVLTRSALGRAPADRGAHRR